MADRSSNQTGDQSAGANSSKTDESLHQNEQNNEWLRDQTGEDHNLSGSSTFRTLPDQPGTGSAKGDEGNQGNQSDKGDSGESRR